MNIFLHFLYTSFIQILLTVFTWVMLSLDKRMDRGLKRDFRLLLLFNLIYLVTSFTDRQICFGTFPPEQLPGLITLRSWATAVGYCCKVLILPFLFLGLYKIPKKALPWVMLPALLAVIAALLSVKTQWIYRMSPDNVYYSGPLKIPYMVIVYAYFLAIIVLLLFRWKQKTPPERLGILSIIVINTLATVFGLLHTYETDFLTLAINVSVVVYFLLLFIDSRNTLLAEQEATIHRQQTELMNSQIQPHFVYNTLSVACGLCREDPEKAEQILLDFSGYLRDNLDFGNANSVIAVEKELEHTKLYTNIEQTRFPALQVEYIVEDSGFNLPFLTIQPMVENAIRHGVRGLDGGKVTVTLRREDAFHRITIRDNGTGKSLISPPGASNHKGIGIENVRSRIESLVNGTVTIKFTAAGTVVTILIPAKD